MNQQLKELIFYTTFTSFSNSISGIPTQWIFKSSCVICLCCGGKGGKLCIRNMFKQICPKVKENVWTAIILKTKEYSQPAFKQIIEES